MQLDIVIGVVILLFGYTGFRNGLMGQLGRLVVALIAAIGAKFLAAPVSNAILKGVEWTPSMALGASFVCAFLVLLMVGLFALGALMKSDGGDGTGLDTGFGSILGLATGALVCFSIVCGGILLTQHLAAKKPGLAVQWQKSRVGRFALTHNFVDPQPFPNARVLLALVGRPDPKKPSKKPTAIGPIRENPKWQPILKRQELVAALERGDWKMLRKQPEFLDLITDAEFIKAAADYEAPHHKIEAEVPEDRFNELKGNADRPAGS